MLVFDRHDPENIPAYFVVLDFSNGEVAAIRDFLLARYALDGAKWSLCSTLDQSTS